MLVSEKCHGKIKWWRGRGAVGVLQRNIIYMVLTLLRSDEGGTVKHTHFVAEETEVQRGSVTCPEL